MPTLAVVRSFSSPCCTGTIEDSLRSRYQPILGNFVITVSYMDGNIEYRGLILRKKHRAKIQELLLLAVKSIAFRAAATQQSSNTLTSVSSEKLNSIEQRSRVEPCCQDSCLADRAKRFACGCSGALLIDSEKFFVD